MQHVLHVGIPARWMMDGVNECVAGQDRTGTGLVRTGS